MSFSPGLVACRDCRYWQERRELVNTPAGPTRMGDCVRFPPSISILMTPQGQQPATFFPVTTALQSCGEFNPKNLIEA